MNIILKDYNENRNKTKQTVNRSLTNITPPWKTNWLPSDPSHSCKCWFEYTDTLRSLQGS